MGQATGEKGITRMFKNYFETAVQSVNVAIDRTADCDTDHQAITLADAQIVWLMATRETEPS